MNRITLSRALAGLALDVRHGRPTPKQWGEAIALVAGAERTPGHWLELEFTPGGVFRLHERPLPIDPEALPA